MDTPLWAMNLITTMPVNVGDNDADSTVGLTESDPTIGRIYVRRRKTTACKKLLMRYMYTSTLFW